MCDSHPDKRARYTGFLFPLFSFSSEIHLLLLAIQVSFYTNVLIFLQTNIAKTKVTLISLKRQGWSLAEKNFLRVYVFFKAYPPILRSLMRRANLHLGALFVQQLRTEVGVSHTHRQS